MTALVATATMTVYRWHHSCWTNYQQWQMGKQRRGGAAWIPPGTTAPWPVLQQHGWEHSHTQQSCTVQRYNRKRVTRSTEKIMCLSATSAGYLDRESSRTTKILLVAALHSGKWDTGYCQSGQNKLKYLSSLIFNSSICLHPVLT